MEKMLIIRVIEESGGNLPSRLKNLVLPGLPFTGRWRNTGYNLVRMSKRLTFVWLTIVFGLFLALAIFSFHDKNSYPF